MHGGDLPKPASYLFYNPSVGGGIPRHSHYQAQELAARGARVTMLCRRDFPMPAGGYTQLRWLVGITGQGFWRKLLRVLASIVNYHILACTVLLRRPQIVLLEANTEYFSPLWALPHVVLSRLGFLYLANFHDPVRERRFGPDWLHRLSVWLANAPLRGGLVHGAIPDRLDFAGHIAFASVPHGLFEEAAQSPPAFDLRDRFGIPPGQFVVLSFGLIGDRKNLDLLIEAAVLRPDLAIVVAGQDVSHSQKPSQFYRDLAAERGVADRVHFDCRYIAEDQISAYFLGADAIALTYNREFVSQSGVLQLAVLWDRPILASGGPGPLQDAIEGGLGLFVEPDSTPAIVAGLDRIRGGWHGRPEDFGAYRAKASWSANVDQLEALAQRLLHHRR